MDAESPATYSITLSRLDPKDAKIVRSLARCFVFSGGVNIDFRYHARVTADNNGAETVFNPLFPRWHRYVDHISAAGGYPLLPARQVQAALYADQGMLETDGELMLIPKSSIKYMTVSPLAVELPETVIRGGSVVTAWSVFGG